MKVRDDCATYHRFLTMTPKKLLSFAKSPKHQEWLLLFIKPPASRRFFAFYQTSYVIARSAKQRDVAIQYKLYHFQKIYHEIPSPSTSTTPTISTLHHLCPFETPQNFIHHIIITNNILLNIHSIFKPSRPANYLLQVRKCNQMTDPH